MYGSNTFAEGYMIGRDNSNTANNGNGNGWGDAWWIVVLLIFGWGGFGNGNGWGNRGGASSGGSSAADGYVLATDFANIERKIDGVNNGLCDGFYSVNTAFGNLNNTISQNTAQLQNSMNQGFNGLNTAVTSQGYENRIAVNGLGTQLASCCCDIREGISGVNYNMSTQANAISNQISSCCCESQRQVERGFCDTNYNAATNTRDIIQSTHNDTDRIIARLDAMENSRKDERIAALLSENQSLKLGGALANMRNDIVDDIRPCPKPAYITCNPYSYQTYNSGCQCC